MATSAPDGAGQVLAAVVMLLGFGIIAIPTGIVTVEPIQQARQDRLRVCSQCGHQEHRRGALHRDQCGAPLPFRLNRLLAEQGRCGPPAVRRHGGIRPSPSASRSGGRVTMREAACVAVLLADLLPP